MVVPLPSPSFVFSATPLPPRQQATVGLTLATAFPHDITCTLTMTPMSDALVPTDDPAIQFLTSGRQATVSILANTTQTQIGFQTGNCLWKHQLRDDMPRWTNLPTSASASNSLPQQAPTITQVQKDSQSGLRSDYFVFNEQRNYTVKFSIQHASTQLSLWYGIRLLRFGIDNDF